MSVRSPVSRNRTWPCLHAIMIYAQKTLKYAPILLKFGVVNCFIKLFLHTKFEPNRSIFDLARVLSEPLKCPKMVRSCSNFKRQIHLMSCFCTQNLSKIGAFLTFSKKVQVHGELSGLPLSRMGMSECQPILCN